MKFHNTVFIIVLFILPVFVCFAPAVEGAGKSQTSCKIRFSLEGWSIFYETASGRGTITCDNGQSARVKIDVKGGGLTVGKSRVENGIGKFSEVTDISELYGPYVKAEAHAGAVKSADAQVLTKGVVSLALAGTGKGVNLGISFGRFTIKRVGK